MSLCEFLYFFFTGTAAAADDWNQESEENQKFLPEVNSTGEEKQRFHLLNCLYKMSCLTVSSIKLSSCPKGPDNKLMVFKLKTQLEELRSKVVFLDSVKKYLEVLT